MAGVAQKFLGISGKAGVVRIGFSVLVLGIDDRQTDLNRVEFVAADPAADDFVLAGVHVKTPEVVTLVLDERDGHRPAIVADGEVIPPSGLGRS